MNSLTNDGMLELEGTIVQVKFPKYDRGYAYWTIGRPEIGDKLEVVGRDTDYQEVEVIGYGRDGYVGDLKYARPCGDNVLVKREDLEMFLGFYMFGKHRGKLGPVAAAGERLAAAIGGI